MFRRRWMVAIGVSAALHAAAVLAMTPSEAPSDEAGSGTGGPILGSVDAIVGIDMPVETLSEPQDNALLASTSTEEVVEAAASETAAAQATTLAAIAEPTEAVAAVPSSVEAANPAVAQDAAAASPLEAIDAPAAEADLAAAPVDDTATPSTAVPVAEAVRSAEIETAAPRGSTEAFTVAAETVAIAASDPHALAPAPAQDPAEAEAAEVTGTVAWSQLVASNDNVDELTSAPVAEVEPVPEAKAAAEAKPEPKPAAKKQPVPTTAPAPKSLRREAARGNSDADSRQGAEAADLTSQGRDPGMGRSRETGSGAALASRYSGQVASRLRRARRHPGGDAQGIVQLAFAINGNGTVSGLRLVASSGNALLDQAALDTVRRAAPFPPPPVAGFAIHVPIRFGTSR